MLSVAKFNDGCRELEEVDRARFDAGEERIVLQITSLIVWPKEQI
jgi:hypothetical protein